MTELTWVWIAECFHQAQKIAWRSWLAFVECRQLFKCRHKDMQKEMMFKDLDDARHFKSLLLLLMFVLPHFTAVPFHCKWVTDSYMLFAAFTILAFSEFVLWVHILMMPTLDAGCSEIDGCDEEGREGVWRSSRRLGCRRMIFFCSRLLYGRTGWIQH